MGTGTSQGIPVIGCQCEVCQSNNPKDKRLRTSALLKVSGKYISIDCGPDFRQQMLREGINSLSGVVITHEHNDHIIGLDDVRPFNYQQNQPMRIYADVRVKEEIKRRFAYIFNDNPYPGAPKVIIETIHKDHHFEVEGVPFIPIEVIHGKLPILGFRVGNLAYLTDVKYIQSHELKKLKNIEVLVINALHHKEHFTHLNLKEAIDLIEIIQPDRAYLTHLSHRMGLFDEVNPSLPSHIQLAYDGLRIGTN